MLLIRLLFGTHMPSTRSIVYADIQAVFQCFVRLGITLSRGRQVWECVAPGP